MEKLDLDEIRQKWLNQCGSCDAGLPMNCTCTTDDPRHVILALVNHLEDLYGNHDMLLCSTMGGAVDELELLTEARGKLREVYLMARDQSFTSAAAKEIMLLIPPKLIIHKPGLDNQVS